MEKRETCCVTALSLINPIWIFTSDTYLGLNKRNALSLQAVSLTLIYLIHLIPSLKIEVVQLPESCCRSLHEKVQVPGAFSKVLVHLAAVCALSGVTTHIKQVSAPRLIYSG